MNLQNEDGMTLIEVLISMGIIAIAALGGIAQYHNAGEVKQIALHKKIALQMANTKLEEFRGMAYTDSALSIGTTTSDETIGGLAANVSDGLGWTIVVSDAGNGCKQVQVDLDWKEMGMNDKVFNVSLATYKRP